jgi:nucleoid-associated protein YgaU
VAVRASVYWRRRAVALLAAVAIVVGLGWVVASAATRLVASTASTTVVATGAVDSSSVATPEVTGAPAAGRGATGLPHTYVVQPGDTLWTIAQRLHPDGDIRALVDQMAANHGGASLSAGERLDLDALSGSTGG